MSIILFIIILGILVVSHEFGHFIVAKMSGMRVDEFGFGFPPRMFGIKRGETTYSINWIPFGGFVKIWGEDAPEGAEQLPEYDRSFTGKPKHIQAAVVVAGVVFNFILAWFLFTAGFMIGMPVPGGETMYGTPENAAVVITQVFPDTPAAAAELAPGDVLLRAGNEPIDSGEEFQNLISANGLKSIPVTYTRNGQEFTKEITPMFGEPESRPIVGVGIESLGTVQLGPLSAIAAGFTLTADITLQTIIGLIDFAKNLFTNTAMLDTVTGPVGIIGLVGSSLAFGFVHLLTLTAVISINLAVLNLVPFPALDGGRLLFIIIEKIKGSPIAPRIANSINAAGFFALLLLMAIITWRDITHLVTG